MLEIAGELVRWLGEGRDFAVATVVAVRGSAPRQPGAALAVDTGGQALGSVSGGCVEGAVYELCRAALASGRSTLERFGPTDGDADGDGDAFAVGLTCGGELEVLVTPVRAGDPERVLYEQALTAAARGGRVALARAVHPPWGALLARTDGTYAGTLGPQAARTARAALDAGRTGTVRTGCTPLFVECAAPPPRLLVFGAVDFAAALARAGRFLGHHVTVCDARPVFATRSRFPDAHEVVADWPHRYLARQRLDARAALCVLTHDAKFDIPLLERALRLPVAYVGAMGSRRTHETRLNLLREAGLGEAELSRLHSPIGLDLGARTPEETALSIAAEIVAVRRGGTGIPLTDTDTPIHRDEPAHLT
ncbi:XdhC family protein [Streptomyces gamaensis]|uniref:XdhC family protein n=1 Tax=Streptomyces gamaensis TaxID=1763542 RepID=A0ABW0YRI8_9ACTN